MKRCNSERSDSLSKLPPFLQKKLTSDFLLLPLFPSLQTGMRGAFGKPYDTVARVTIGQVLLSVRTREANKATAIEALRRSRYKFAGRQKIIVSKKWGFTNMNREEYVQARNENRVLKDGCYLQYINNHGPLSKNLATRARIAAQK